MYNWRTFTFSGVQVAVTVRGTLGVRIPTAQPNPTTGRLGQDSARHVRVLCSFSGVTEPLPVVMGKRGSSPEGREADLTKGTVAVNEGSRLGPTTITI